MLLRKLLYTGLLTFVLNVFFGLSRVSELRDLLSQFNLQDNTPANHFVGNIFTHLSEYQASVPFTRVLLVPDNLFRLNLKGELYTRVFLDRDVLCGRFECCAKDICHIQMDAYVFGSSQTPNQVRILVNLTDENDNGPVFLSSQDSSISTTNEGIPWEIGIPESAPIGSTHSLPTATDADSPKFGLKRYRLFPISNHNQGHSILPFSLVDDIISGPLLQLDVSLDREAEDIYDFYLIAEDGGLPFHSTTLTTRVRVLDVNDNAPEFLNYSTNLTVREDTSPGKVIYQFFARDLDAGLNGQISYSMDMLSTYPGNSGRQMVQLRSKYELDEKTGRLTVLKRLDYENEMERLLIFIVKTRDHGDPSLTATLSFTLTVQDVNDNNPVVTVLTANTADTNETHADSVILWENDSSSHLLKLLSVTDADSVSTGKVTCLVADLHRKDFELSSYSESMYGLMNKRAFDFETETTGDGYLDLSVQCVDKAEPELFTTKLIRIPLGNEDDNVPQFSQVSYQFYIPEDMAIGSEIGRIHATDADNPFGMDSMIYELQQTSTSDWLRFVNIDPESGIMYLSAKLDREKLAQFELHAIARDNIDYESTRRLVNKVQPVHVRKLNRTRIIITVTDVNDNAPVYVGPNDIHVSENVPIGTEIISNLGFKDPDSGLNGTVSVFLLGPITRSSHRKVPPFLNEEPKGLHKSAIELKDSTRLVTVTPIDREQQAQMVITVLATDQGQPFQLTTTLSLTVHIDDLNDNYPHLVYPNNASILNGYSVDSGWSDTFTSSLISTDLPVGSFVSTIHAKDPDAGNNGTVTYYLIPWSEIHGRVGSRSYLTNQEALDGFSYFSIDPHQGHLRTAWGSEGIMTMLKSDSQIGGNVSHRNWPHVHFRHLKTKSPRPGLYGVAVELRDGGTPPLITKCLFYVNVTEAVGNSIGFFLFGDKSLSNTIMMTLILGCSFVLIASLISAIVWVRFRNVSPIRSEIVHCPEPTNYHTTRILSPDEMANGYVTTTIHPSQLVKHMHANCGDEDVDWSKMNLNESTFSPPNKGYCGYEWASMRASSFMNWTQYSGLNKEENVTFDPSKISCGYRHMMPVLPSDNQTSLKHCPLGTNYYSPEGSLSVQYYRPVLDLDHTAENGCNSNQNQLNYHHQNQNTNNSTGGSDSGVDSGTGGMIPIPYSEAASASLHSDLGTLNQFGSEPSVT
ncbi:Protocadherin-11 Y-linked [Paragonimus heterotremus]|uniref:Protocadherin-11 Y-linked n=1 Tax=Paragonimus heterotremus TaxID=100268 RepID=A0A8J4WTK2_9TREM|nr:Protocadherin-11 Y-linked [Paragonimus heterotremus]